MSDEKLLTIIIPTRGRPSIQKTLASIWSDASAEDVDVLVVIDSHQGAWKDIDIRETAQDWDARVIEHDAGHHCWGHCQINAGIEHAEGAYLAFIDDDDEFVEGGVSTILDAIEFMGTPPVPIMVQFLAHWGEIIWPAPVVEFQRIGGHCLVAPNISEKLGQWTCRYEGDYDFIASTLRYYRPHEVLWLPKVVAIARPAVNPMAHQQVMVTH